MSEDGQQLTQVTEMVMKTGKLCNYKYALATYQYLSALMLYASGIIRFLKPGTV